MALGLAKKYLIHKLNESPGLAGTIEGLELHLLRHALVLRNVHIAKTSGRSTVVEASICEITLHFQWRELWEGALVGRLQVHTPCIQITAESENDINGKAPADAILALCRESRRFMPFRLLSIDVKDGLIVYRNQFTNPPFHVSAERISLHATNVTNIPAATDSEEAQIALEGQTTGHGKLWLYLNLPPLSEALTFHLRVGLCHVNLVDLNDVLQAHANFDLKRGVCSVYAEFRVAQGVYQGFIQPHFQDLDVFAWQKEQNKTFFNICRQAVLAMFASLFKSRHRNELALKIPVSGTFADADVDFWSAAGSLLKNAFGRSLIPGFGNGGSQTKERSWQLFSLGRKE